jgi:GrpB-like predicted nucleotidyltransferase (UPF0157 family)
LIRLVPYDAGWPAAFEREAAEIRRVLGGLARRIEHVGSTSVPGLTAKPVIDIQVSVPALDPIARYEALLGPLGYTHLVADDFDRVYPFFHKPADWPATHHIHLCVEHGDLEARHLAFRDELRASPRLAREYVALKQALAARHDGASFESRERYSLGKTDFIESVLRGRSI